MSEGTPRAVSLACIADAWIRRLACGRIRYDPAQVQCRWLPDPAQPLGQFRIILNAGRAERQAGSTASAGQAA